MSTEKPKARLLVSLPLLHKLLELPDGVRLVGAQTLPEASGDSHTIALLLDGEGAPDSDGHPVNATYSEKPRFDRFEPADEECRCSRFISGTRPCSCWCISCRLDVCRRSVADPAQP
jgi:hypothetical protein